MFFVAAILWLIMSVFAYKTGDSTLLNISLFGSMICALGAYIEQRFNQIINFFRGLKK